MSRRSRSILIGSVLALIMMFTVSCYKEAKDQISAADKAVAEARAIEAERYAPLEFRSAEESLAMARKEYERWQFPKALEYARNSETQARLAYNKAWQEINKPEPEPPPPPPPPPSPPPPEIEFRDINFLFDSAELSSSARAILDQNALELQKFPEAKMVIEGHCDDRGTDEYNLALGARRAKTAADYLISQGVDPTRISTISYGEMQPLDPGQNEEAWARNRRAHFEPAGN